MIRPIVAVLLIVSVGTAVGAIATAGYRYAQSRANKPEQKPIRLGFG